MIAQVRTALGSHYQLTEFRICSLSETRRVSLFLRAMLYWLRSLLKLRPVALQVVLFFDAARIRELVGTVQREQPDCIYFDGVRTIEYLLAVKRLSPGIRAVCDLDDLMSRRMALLRQARLGISAGYLSKHTPSWIQKFFLRGPIGQLVTAYEQAALRRAESAALRTAEGVVVASVEDARCLSVRAAPSVRSRITVVPPATAIRRPIWYPQSPLRFVFLGSDGLTQNQLTIRWLLQLWREVTPTTPLHLYGRMQCRYDKPRNVYFEGFAESLDKVYTCSSVLLAPSFLAGGIKTKVLEAIAHGVIAVGNAITFEGLDFDAGELALTSDGIEELVRSPVEHLDTLYLAAVKVQDRCRVLLDPTVVHAKWVRLSAAEDRS